MESKIPSFNTNSGLLLLKVGTVSNFPGKGRTSCGCTTSSGGGVAGIDWAIGKISNNGNIYLDIYQKIGFKTPCFKHGFNLLESRSPLNVLKWGNVNHELPLSNLSKYDSRTVAP